MSVLIKGMAMPESCWKCPLETDYGTCGYYSLFVEAGHDSNYEKRPDDCPLIELSDTVKHGRWKNKQMHDEELNEIQVFRHRCSECRFEICTTDETLWWQYCPNCGAKMEQEDEDE